MGMNGSRRDCQYRAAWRAQAEPATFPSSAITRYRGLARKKRTISAVASGPAGSV